MKTMSDVSLKILDVLQPTAIISDLKATTKKGALEELVAALGSKVKDSAATVQVLLEREKIGSTGIGQGIAIPHAKTDQVSGLCAAFGMVRRGVAFDSLDGEPAHIIFLLVAPPDAAADHLKALARISRMLKDKFFRQSLRDAKDSAEILRLIKQEDTF